MSGCLLFIHTNKHIHLRAHTVCGVPLRCDKRAIFSTRRTCQFEFLLSLFWLLFFFGKSFVLFLLSVISLLLRLLVCYFIFSCCICFLFGKKMSFVTHVVHHSNRSTVECDRQCSMEVQFSHNQRHERFQLMPVFRAQTIFLSSLFASEMKNGIHFDDNKTRHDKTR